MPGEAALPNYAKVVSQMHVQRLKTDNVVMCREMHPGVDETTLRLIFHTCYGFKIQDSIFYAALKTTSESSPDLRNFFPSLLFSFHFFLK